MKPFYEHPLFIKIVKWKPIAQLLLWSKKVVVPGFDGLPLFDALFFFLKGIIKGSLAPRAAAIAYNFFLALFPAILFFFTLIPYIPINDFQATLMNFLRLNLPQSAYLTVYSTVNDILSKPRGDLLSIGIFAALFFSTNGFKSIISAFNMTYYEVKPRSFWQTQLVALFMVIISSILVIVSISLFTFSNFVLDYLVQKGILQLGVTYYIILVSQGIIQVSLIYFIISFIYYFAPATRKRFRFFSAGSTLATLLYIVSYYGFNFYINNFSKYNALYGSIGTLIIFLIWIYFIAMIILIGYELNISIQIGRDKLNTYNFNSNSSHI